MLCLFGVLYWFLEGLYVYWCISCCGFNWILVLGGFGLVLCLRILLGCYVILGGLFDLFSCLIV